MFATATIALHGIAWHRTALHCIALHLHRIALHCIGLNCIGIALHCIALTCIALRCIALHRIELHCIALPHIALLCIALHCIASLCPLYMQLLEHEPSAYAPTWATWLLSIYLTMVLLMRLGAKVANKQILAVMAMGLLDLCQRANPVRHGCLGQLTLPQGHLCQRANPVHNGYGATWATLGLL